MAKTNLTLILSSLLSLTIITGCAGNNSSSEEDSSSNTSSEVISESNASSEVISESSASSEVASESNISSEVISESSVSSEIGPDSSESSTSISENTSESISENTSESTSENNSVIDWSTNSYYGSLNKSNDEIGDLARLLRSTLVYQTYGDARYNYAVDSKTGYQYVLYETTGKKVPLTWGDGVEFTLPDGTNYKIEREHILPKSNMKIRPVSGSNKVNTFPIFELDSDSNFFKTYSSKSINDAKGHHTDWHNLWNAVGSWNGNHSNSFYGASNLNHTQVSPGKFGGGWYPGAEFVGDVARAVFYMTLTYPFVTLVDSSSNKGENSIYYGYLDYLLKWNEIDPVSPEEIDRNEKIFAKQKNRNPFIDFYNQDFASFVFANGDPEIPQ